MESDKVPPGASNTTVRAFFPFVSGLTVTFDTFPCRPMAQSMPCSRIPRRDCWKGLSDTTRISAESSFHLLSMVTASSRHKTMFFSHAALSTDRVISLDLRIQMTRVR